MYRRMVVGRRFDAQATALTKQGRLAVYPSSRGQEACQVGGVLAVRDTDWVFPTYRESMALTARGIDPVEVLTLLRGDWHCGYDPTRVHTAPQCTPLATQCVHAAGLAYGESYQGRDTVALAFIGDGATSEGDFHEGVNFAAVFKAPVVYFVQNNKYAISVPLSRQTAAPSLAYKGVGYGVPSEQVDGNDPVAVLAVLTRAVEHARSGKGPFLVEAHTYRMEAHTNADDASRYRDPDEVEAWRDRDPVARLETYLRARGVLDDAAVAAIAEEAEAYAADLRERMNAQPAGRPAQPLRPRLRRADPAAGRAARAGPRRAGRRPGRGGGRLMATMTMAKALNAALADAMLDDERVVVFGEDVGQLGGVFRITDGLQARFGDKRCFDTPLAEAGIVGFAVGLAMSGLRPVVEMQFDAFAYPAFEQIASHVAKLRNRTRGALSVPIVIRVPYAGGIGGVEHHCDSSEAYYAHTPGLKVVTPATVEDAYSLLREAIDDPDPVVFMEPKKLYFSSAEAELPAPHRAVRHGPSSAGPAPTPPWSRTARRCPSRWRPPRPPARRAGTWRWSTCAPSCRSTTPPSPRRCARPAAAW